MGPEHSQPLLQGHSTLAAIVFSDVVNYSGRMSRNEEITLKLVRHDLDQMTRCCEQFEGKVLKFTGDGLLMYFTSAVQAVACALEIQNTFAARASEFPNQDFLQHRIGIHLGDVFVSPTDVMGDGVNIAARLQSEADPGGICLSQIVYDVVKKRLALQATYLGPRELKHIQEAVPIYQIVLAAQSKTTTLSNGDTSVSTLGAVKVVQQELNVAPATGFDLTEEVKKSLEHLVAEVIGPIAPVIVQQTLKQAHQPEELINRLANQLPESEQPSFRARASRLLSNPGMDKTPQQEPGAMAMPESTIAENLEAIAPDFIHCCELELTKMIGPIARMIIQRTLTQQPQISSKQLIEALVKLLPDPKDAEILRQRLLTTLS